MRVIPPVNITPTKLQSSTATEVHNPAEYNPIYLYAIGSIVKVAADYKIYESLAGSSVANNPSTSPLYWRVLGPTETAYASGTTYALGATCSYNRRCYESLQAGNINHTPPTYPETETTYWLDVGPTNKWAAFDLQRNTQTVTEGTMTIVVKPGERVNTIGLTGLKANRLQISATSVIGGGAVYPNIHSKNPTGIFDLNTREVFDGYSYCFEPFSTRGSNVVFDLPMYSDIIITIVLSSTSGNVKVGSVVLGTYVYLGDVQYHAQADSLNFSSIERDLYGNATLVPRAAYPKTNQTLILPSRHVNKVMAAKKLLDAKPALWTGLDDSTNDWFEMLQILGIWKEFAFNAFMPETVEITLSLEEI